MIQVAPSVAKLRLDMPLTIAKGADPVSRFSPITWLHHESPHKHSKAMVVSPGITVDATQFCNNSWCQKKNTKGHPALNSHVVLLMAEMHCTTD